jgi:hypothetical protein
VEFVPTILGTGSVVPSLAKSASALNTFEISGQPQCQDACALTRMIMASWFYPCIPLDLNARRHLYRAGGVLIDCHRWSLCERRKAATCYWKFFTQFFFIFDFLSEEAILDNT